MVIIFTGPISWYTNNNWKYHSNIYTKQNKCEHILRKQIYNILFWCIMQQQQKMSWNDNCIKSKSINIWLKFFQINPFISYSGSFNNIKIVGPLFKYSRSLLFLTNNSYFPLIVIHILIFFKEMYEIHPIIIKTLIWGIHRHTFKCSVLVHFLHLT